MGIRGMQGVSAHIEYIRKDYDTVKLVNCKFWENEICYNNIAFRYGDVCRSKRGCSYSIPRQTKEKKKSTTQYKQPNKNSVTVKTTVRKHSSLSIKNEILTKIHSVKVKYEGREYDIKVAYLKEKELMQLLFGVNERGKTKIIQQTFNVNKIMKVSSEEVKFIMDINNIVNSLKNQGYYDIAKLVRKNNEKDIVRIAMLKDEEDIKKKLDSFIKFTAYLSIREFNVYI